MSLSGPVERPEERPTLKKRESIESIDDDRRPKLSRGDSGPVQGDATEEDVAHERRHRDHIRSIQNAGTEAYQAKDFALAKDKFETALKDHLRHFEAPVPSGNTPPSRILADRDSLKAKLLKYLSRSLDKLGDDEGSKARLEEAGLIERRLAEYEKRKKEHQKRANAERR